MADGDPSAGSSGSGTLAAPSPEESDELVARRLHAVEQLIHVYGFSPDLAENAVEAVGCGDLAACLEHLLDMGVPDRGGPVTPIANCPHLASRVKLTVNQLPCRPHSCVCTYFQDTESRRVTAMETGQSGESKSVRTEDGTCPLGENWLCLYCGAIRCSRYVNAHGLVHWRDTQRDDAESGIGHCISLSLADFSVWCHACGAYIHNPSLAPILRRMEALKFVEDSTATRTVPQERPRTPPRMRKKARSLSPMEAESVAESKELGIPNGCQAKNAGAVEASTSSSESEGGEEEEEAEEEEYDDSDDDDDGTDGDGSPDLPDDAELVNMIGSAALARGIPFEWLLQEAEDEGEIEYPFKTMPSSVREVADFISSPACRSILVLAGAGMSVAAGIPDFRSADGLYSTMDANLLSADESQRLAIKLDPTVALDHNLFMENPLPCLELNREFILGTCEQRWKATLAHRFVELLHTKTNKLVRLYTQNIDGLEDQCTRLPRDKVINVHGSMDRAECATCKSEGDMRAFTNQVRRQIKDLSRRDSQAPQKSTAIDCSICGCSTMKPAIVLFRSSLPREFFEKLPGDTEAVDLLIVIGTSLRVAPANSLVWRVPKSTLRVLINREPEGMHLGMEFDPNETKRDYFAQGDCDEVLLELMAHLGWLDDLAPLLEGKLLPESSTLVLRGRLERGTAKCPI